MLGGEVTASVDFWSYQVEAGAKATSPMPSGTRAAASLRFVIPAAVTSITYTFDDMTTQQVTGLTPGQTYTVPTNLPRSYIRQIATP